MSSIETKLYLVQELISVVFELDVQFEDIKLFIDVATEQSHRFMCGGTNLEIKIDSDVRREEDEKTKPEVSDDEEINPETAWARPGDDEPEIDPEAESDDDDDDDHIPYDPEESDDESECDPEADTDDEEEMEVSEIVFDGKVAYLNDDTGMIFDPTTQDELGLVSKVATKISTDTYIKLVEKPKKTRTYKTFPQWSHPFGKHTELCQDFLNRLKSTTTAIEIEKMKPEFGKLLKKLNGKTAGIESEDQIDTFGYSWTAHQISVYGYTLE